MMLFKFKAYFLNPGIQIILEIQYEVIPYLVRKLTTHWKFHFDVQD